jgi:Fe-Mn family superoxide dismutase
MQLAVSLFRLPSLPYGYAALEPSIDARTMMLHHDKHHASYVEQLNTALQTFPELHGRSPAWLLLNLIKVPEPIRALVRHIAGGYVNHSLFWHAMSPTGGGEPIGALRQAIVRDFGSVQRLKTQFAVAGQQQFASGWVWLVRTQGEGGRLKVLSTAGHENPASHGYYPLLVNDVWEHAYYLTHQNRRAEYLERWWAVANWAEAARRYDAADQSAQHAWEDEGGRVYVAPT